MMDDSYDKHNENNNFYNRPKRYEELVRSWRPITQRIISHDVSHCDHVNNISCRNISKRQYTSNLFKSKKNYSRTCKTILLTYEDLFGLIKLTDIKTQSTKAANSMRSNRLSEIKVQYSSALEELKKTDANFANGRKTAPSKWANKDASEEYKNHINMTKTTSEKKSEQIKNARQMNKRKKDANAAKEWIYQLTKQSSFQ